MADRATLAELRRQAGKLRRRAERLEELAERLGKPVQTYRAVKAQRAEVREQAQVLADQRPAHVPLPVEGCGCPRCQAAADELAKTPTRVLCQFAVYALDPARAAWSRSMVLRHFRLDLQHLAAALPPEPVIWRFMDDLRRARGGSSA